MTANVLYQDVYSSSEHLRTSLYMDNNSSCGQNENCSMTFWLETTDSGPPLSHDPRLFEFQTQSRFWVQRVLVPIIMILGVLGNTVTIVIMTRRRMRSSTNNYLAALAIFDMIYLVFSFVLSFQHYPNIHHINNYIYWRMYPFAVTLTDASSNTSVWLTVTFTIERYIAVCHPMKGKVLCTESRAKKVILCVFLICFSITLPTLFEWQVIEELDSFQNTTIVRTTYTDMGNNPVYVSVYYWMTAVLFVIIPFLLLAIFNTFLIRSVHSSKVRRKTMTQRKDSSNVARHESKITIMLIAVVILFFVCQLPTAVNLLYRSFHHVEVHSDEDLLLRSLGNICNFLVAINAAGNFILYCLLSQKYWRTFLKIFCPCLSGRMLRLRSVYQNTIYSTVDNAIHTDRQFSVRSVHCIDNAEHSLISKTAVKSSLHTLEPASLNISSAKSSSSSLCNEDKEGSESSVEAWSTSSGRTRQSFHCPWQPRLKFSGLREELQNQVVSMHSINDDH